MAATSPPPGALRILGIVEWLSGDECRDLDDAGLAAGLGRRLAAAGLPIGRLTLHLRTLHPALLGRSVAWAPGAPVEIYDQEQGADTLPDFARSALRRVMETGEPVVIRCDRPDGNADAALDMFRGRGLVELVLVPLSNADGPVAAAAFGTGRPGGFTDLERAQLDRVLPALRSAVELRTLRRLELPLLDAHLGPATAGRLLALHMRRGTVEPLEAALLLCNMQGGDLSAGLAPERAIALADRCVERLRRAGGEVAEVTGDAVLALFPGEAAAAATAALAAAEDLPLPIRIALHYGRVTYGSVGGFRHSALALVGPDIDLLRRIRETGGREKRTLLMSEPFARLLDPGRATPVGILASAPLYEPRSSRAARPARNARPADRGTG